MKVYFRNITSNFKNYQAIAYLLCLLGFYLPSNLALHFFDSNIYEFGFKNNYLEPAIFIQDVIIVAILLFNIRFTKNVFTKVELLFLIFLLTFIPIYSEPKSFLSSIILLRYLVYFFVIKSLTIEDLKYFWKGLEIGIFFNLLVAIYQITFGKSLFEYWLFGESPLKVGFPGIATFTLNSKEFLRGYGISAHPNILATIVVFYLVFNFKKFTFKIRCFIMLLIMTLSQMPLIAWLLTKFIEVKNIMNKMLLLITLVILIVISFRFESSMSYFRRIESFGQAFELTDQKLSSGWGLARSVDAYVNTYTFRENYFPQPLPNVFLVIFIEGGILSLVVFILLIYYFTVITRFKFSLFLLLLLVSDHLLFTTVPGFIVLTFILVHAKEKPVIIE